MHGCGSGSAFLVNAEVDSMGGVVEGGVGIGIKTSPRRAAIERAQAELRQEYDVREERRRELEFLEKGGNPLDFKFGSAASVSVQSTSLTDHHTEHFVTSEAKGSFALTASPPGDSVESSGRPGAPTVCEPNSADNFDGENEILEGERKPKHPSRRSNVAASEQSSQMEGTQNAKESEDSAIVRPYARRNRSRPNRDGARSSSTDVVQSSGGYGSFFKIEITNTQSNMELDGAVAREATTSLSKGSILGDRLDVSETNISKHNQHDQPSQVDTQKIPINMASGECNNVRGKEEVISAAPEYPPVAAAAKTENENGSSQLNGFGDMKGDGNEGQNGNGGIGTKGLDSESSSTQNIQCVDAHNESDFCINGRNDDINGMPLKLTSESEGMQNSVAGEMGNKKNEIKAMDSSAVIKNDNNFLNQNNLGNGCVVEFDEEIQGSSDLQKDLKCPSNLVGVEQNDIAASEADKNYAKRKRIAELSVGIVPLESHRKSHWDFVLEEMMWLANDFAQERLWKMTAAAQICRRVAFTSRLRVEEQNQQWKLKKLLILWQRLSCRGMQRVRDTKSWKEFCMSDSGYAIRFLKCNSSVVPSLQAEAPATPDRIADSGNIGTSWEDHLTEESLFYAVPSGAMATYRISIESHLVQCEKTGSSMQEEVDTSMYDAATVHYQLQSLDIMRVHMMRRKEKQVHIICKEFLKVARQQNMTKRKGKNSMKSSERSYELGPDLPYGYCTTGSQQNTLMGKRPANNLHVGPIPTKRVRSAASRQRFTSHFSAGVGGKSVEVESVGDFEKQLPYDCAETSMKPKKKKKIKHYVGPTYEQVWHLDSTVHNEQRDNSKKRLDSHHFDSNGASGLLYGQHTAKKPKILKQSLDGAFDNMAPMSGSIPSPAASQMSNMPKIIKFITGRDRGRKPKSLKAPAGQPGSRSPWSLFEDQALVVLAHDMGPNWELVSDAINSALQFKCIFRKPKECKERHKILMDKGAGDGADSADDSGSSQSYPSTLPGIPKGSARQLFQRLQGPMEEDTLKSHFEKIIMIGKKYLYRRSQPLDICDATASSPDILPIHASGLSTPNQGAVGSMLPISGTNSSLQVPPGVVLGNNSSQPGPLNAPIRWDGRYSVPRTSLPVDDQQKMQHYNQMLSNRSLQQSNLPVSGALSGADRRILQGGNPVGMMSGMNRSMPLSRPGFQGVASSSMMNSTSMLSSGVAGMPSPVSMQSGSSSGQGNSMMRSREALHLMRVLEYYCGYTR
ncbi:hypothetical protein GH714_025913 [Hevea brasiliensis]|uniref:Myb-like domain-containing protein n=1 Tax=Hevea brasiliensis TaxID=3981 RepID=A0A6A6KUA5_HEVBR|nr:hypothetical protein GH714_025913 [Hevea brasiliensis]